MHSTLYNLSNLIFFVKKIEMERQVLFTTKKAIRIGWLKDLWSHLDHLNIIS